MSDKKPVLYINDDKCRNSYSCVRVCPVNAIEVKPQKAHPFILPDRCIGCGLCIKICPSFVLDTVETKASVVRAEWCIGCGVCEERCPMSAFTMGEDLAEYDPEKCIGCGLCVSTCPTEAITLAKREDYQRPSATVGELVQKIVSGKRARA